MYHKLIKFTMVVLLSFLAGCDSARDAAFACELDGTFTDDMARAYVFDACNDPNDETLSARDKKIALRCATPLMAEVFDFQVKCSLWRTGEGPKP